MTAYLVFDTNSLPIEGNLESGFWKVLFRLCAVKGIEPAISEVTLHEAVNMRREKANGAIEAFVSSHTRLSRMTTVASVYTPTGGEVAEAYEKTLISLFQVLPLDGEHAREALRREARRIVPAREGKGGRDSAIWLTVAELAMQGHEVHFVTKNTKDFGSGGLLAGLLKEVEDAALPIRYLSSANDFVGTIATEVSLPSLGDYAIANAFTDSIRSEAVLTLQLIESTEYTVDRAYNARVSVTNVRLGTGYAVDGDGIVGVNAITKLADPSGVEWAKATLNGWLGFDPASFELRPSEADPLIDIHFR